MNLINIFGQGVIDLLGDKGFVNKLVPSFFKDKEGKMSSKRMIKTVGGGSLMVVGLGFLGTGMADKDKFFMAGGAFCIAIGAALAIFLAEKVKQVKVSKAE